MQRREFLSAGTGLALGSVISVSATDAAPLFIRKVRDNAAAPELQQGQWLVLNQQHTTYREPGLYLYPDWGNPRAYRITGTSSGLQFHCPGSGTLLWTQPASQTRFGGRVMGVMTSNPLDPAHQSWKELKLPALPG